MVEQSSEVVSEPDEPAVVLTGTGPRGAETERRLAQALADLLDAETVPVDGHFFTDLGANSLVMAQFCARVRKRADLPSPSMKDIYRHPTIRSLAAALAQSAPVAPPVSAPAAEPSAPAHQPSRGTAPDTHRPHHVL
jgi:hypothetical protein